MQFLSFFFFFVVYCLRCLLFAQSTHRSAMEGITVRRAVVGDEVEVAIVVNAAYRGELGDNGTKAWTSESRLVKGNRIEADTAKKMIVDGDIELYLIFCICI
jgi:hypothetical protein